MSDRIARMTTESIRQRIALLLEYGHDKTPDGRRLIAALEAVLKARGGSPPDSSTDGQA